MVRAVIVCCLFVGGVGCKGIDAGLLERHEGAATGDPGRDAGEDAAPPMSCAMSSELCNGKDDDCDGNTDEQASEDCSFAHALGACVPGGTCVIASCDEGYADCNGIADDGCEQLKAEVKCGECGRVCQPDRPPTSGGDDDPILIEDDAGMGTTTPPPPPPVTCTPVAESCNGLDDDCDDWIDESNACAHQMCVASTPSYRGPACDDCVCTNCTQAVADCQAHPDATWRSRCRALVECVVVHDALGECGVNADCYQNNTGPCAAEVNLAAGGSSPTDNSRVVNGCAASTPPVTACAAAVNYRDRCSRMTCAGACAP